MLPLTDLSLNSFNSFNSNCSKPSEGDAAEEAETRKHKINEPKSLELCGVYTAYPKDLYMCICTFANINVYTEHHAPIRQA